MKRNLTLILISVVISSSLIGLSLFVKEKYKPLGTAFNPAGLLTYRLQTSIGTTDTSVKLSSFKNRSDLALTMTLLNTDKGYGTLSPQTTRSEFVSFTGITQNSDGTATLTGVTRGLSDISPFTASTTLRNAHPGQSVFILSDSPQLFEEYAKRRSDETITGLWNFNTVLPTSNKTATTSTQFTTKSYVDNVTNAGAATSTETNGGIVELGTKIEQASSTNGGANKPLVLQTKNATSTPSGTSFSGLFAAISKNNGKLHQLWLDLTETFSWSGNQTWTGSLNRFTGSSKVGIGTSTPYARLSVVGLNQAVFSNIFATTTNATSTFSGNLKIGNNATTTNLFISGNTYGGPMTYTGSSTAFSVSAGTITYTGSIPARANTALIKYAYGSGGGGALSEGMVTITRTGLTVVNVHDYDTAGESGRFEFGWTGNNFYVAENTDGGTTMTGTAYYYK